MNQDDLQASWDQVKDRVRERWGNLTDEDLEAIQGSRDTLVLRVHERYEGNRNEIEHEVEAWLAELEGPESFAGFLGRHIRDRRRDITLRWVKTLEDQLDVEGREVLPSDDLLNHIPQVLERIAGSLADPRARPLEALVVQDLGRLAELRRQQGFGLQELLREYHILSGIIRDVAEAATGSYPGRPDPVEVARTVGRLMDAVNLIGATTVHTLGLWRDRFQQDRDELLRVFGDIVAHELGNRLGAAETALDLLESADSLTPERRTRLHEVARQSLREGQKVVEDASALVRPFSPDTAAEIPLWLVIKESVWLAEHQAGRSGVSVTSGGEVPRVKVPGPAVRIALANLLANGIKHHRDEGEDRWVRVSTRSLDGDERVEVTVEDNGGGISEEMRDRVFEYRFRGDIRTEGSGLGLAITRDVIDQAGGTISLQAGEEGGARFVLEVPATGIAEELE